MAAKRHLSKLHSFFWLLVLAAVAVCTRTRLEEADVYIYQHAAHLLGYVPAERTLHLLKEGQTAPREPDVTVETRRLESPTVGLLTLDEQAAHNCFAALPLGPQDMAVLLHKLTERGVQSLALSAPLTWDGKSSTIARQMVCLGVSNFRHAVLGLRGRNAAEADFTPTPLRSFSIPAEQVEGDPSGLPIANKLVDNELYHTAEAQQLIWAPDWLDDERLTQRPSASQDRSYPLLARWNGEIIPTLPLRLALMIRGYKPSDIFVRIGKEIRLGSITLPMDERGRTRLPHASTSQLQLQQVVEGSPPGPNEPKIVLLAQPHSAQPSADRSRLMAATISQLCATEITEHHIRPGKPGKSLMYSNLLRDWVPLCILAAAALFAVRILPFFPSFLRKLSLLAILAAGLWYSHELMLRGQWIHISSALLTWLTLAVALSILRPRELRRCRR